jgi:hypothetical protein
MPDHLEQLGAGTDYGDVGAQLTGQVRGLFVRDNAYRAPDWHDNPTGSQSDGDDKVPNLFAGSVVDHEAGATHAVDIGLSIG